MENVQRVTQGVTQVPSVAEHLRKSFQKAQASRKPKEIAVPGYDGLFLVFRPLDSYEEVGETIEATMKRLRGQRLTRWQRDVAIAVDTMLLGAIGSYAMVDDVRYEIGIPLGVELYNYIFPPEPDPETGDVGPRPMTDQEAVYMLFLDDLSLMNMASELDEWWKTAGVEVEEEVLGNS